MQHHPIHDINDDLLLLIFGHTELSRSKSSISDVLAISQVCARWRFLATNHCPILWTQLALSGRPTTQKLRRTQDDMLRRCYNLPIDAGWESWERWRSCSQTASQIIADLAHSSRFVAYSLKPPLDRESSRSVLNALRQTPFAPHITELRLSGLTMSRGWHWLQMPSTMFGGDLRSLTTLVLFGCWLDFNKLKIGSQLRVFEAGMCSQSGRERHERKGVPTTFHEWLHALKRSPHLTCLCINQRYGDRSTISPPGPSTSITFRYLTTVSLTFEFNDMKTFLDCVTLPSCETLLLKIHGAAFDDQLYTRVEEVVQRYAKPSRQAPNFLDFFRLGRSSFGCGFWSGQLDILTLPSPYSATPRPSLLVWLDVNASWDFAGPYTNPQQRELGAFLSRWSTVMDYVTNLAITWAPVDFVHCLPAVQQRIPQMTTLRAIICPVVATGELQASIPQGRDISFIGYKSHSNVLSERVTYSPRHDAVVNAQEEGDPEGPSSEWVASLTLHGPHL